MKTLELVNKMKENVTVTGNADYHHLDSIGPDITGLTIRKALKQLRAVDWGNLGGMHLCELSDGTYLSVSLVGVGDGTSLMSSQVAIRSGCGDYGIDKTVRKYKI
jgi:hypothetical protein